MDLPHHSSGERDYITMRTLTAVRPYLAAAFLLVIGLIAYGCGDSATVNPVVELASLTVDPGTLQPAFSGGTTQYNVDVSSNITSVTITAQPAVAGDSVTINGQATTSSVIPLGAAGTTTPVNIVVSESGTNSRTYTVLFVRAGLTGNNSLQNLAVSPGPLDSPFTANDLNYSVDVANTVGSITLTPTLSDPAATMTVNGQATNSGQARTVTLNPAGQPTDIPIVVTAQNGTPKTYQVTVSRGVSGNNNLQGLTVSPGTLDRAFLVSRTSYTVDVASTVASITVTPTRQDPAATITVNGTPATSGQGRSITLNGAGSNTFINIVVTAQNGTQKTYSVNVIRAALGGNNNLSGLTVAPGPLTPAFTAAETSYTVDVASTVASITVTPTRQDSNATITVTPPGTGSGQARTITLNGAGSNTLINIVVTAPNSTQKAYTVNVRRAALGGNNNLSGLTVSPGPLTPAFTAAETSYTVNVASTVASITVTPRVQDPAATMTVTPPGTGSGQARTITLNGAGSNTLINIVVTAPNGSQKPYTITVERAAPGGNNNLSALTVTPGPLVPAFTSGNTIYSLDVVSTVPSVTVTPTLEDPAASLTVTSNGQVTTSGQARTITLRAAGLSTTINIVVRAPNGSEKPYSITVDRAAASSNNNLSALSVNGSSVPGFTQGTLDYTVNVASGVNEVTVSATKSDSNATMAVGSVTVPPGTPTGQTTVPVSASPISIAVTAPGGGAPRTYTVTVRQGPPTPTVAPDLIREDDSCSTGVPPDECAPGTSKEDNITNVTRPRFSIPQPGAGETATLYINGNKDASSSTTGNLLAPSTSLSDATYTITYTLSNSGGESDESPIMMTPPPQLQLLRIDTTGP